MAATDRVAQIDGRLNEIGIREQATQNEQLLVLLAKERVALTDERISLTSPATQPGKFPVPMYSIEPFQSHICQVCILFDDIILSIQLQCFIAVRFAFEKFLLMDFYGCYFI